MTGPYRAAPNPGSTDGQTAALNELPRKLAYAQTLWQKLLYVRWDAQSLELVRRLVHEIRIAAADLGLAAGAESARKLEQQLQVLQSRNGPPPETERSRLQGMLQRLAHVLLEAHAGEGPHRPDGQQSSDCLLTSAEERLAPVDDERPQAIYLLSDTCSADEPWIVRLRHAGYNVLQHAAPADLRRSLRQTRPDMILAEVALAAGGLSGVEAIDAVQSEFGKDIPVMFLAERGDVSARLAAVRIGAAGYFIKPIDEQDLLRRIDEVSPRRKPNYRVLIVEDEDQLAGAYALVLQQAGFIAEVLNQPLRIFEVLQQFQPDLVLMDLHLTTCSGAELMQLIRQEAAYYALPIVFLSGDADPARHNAVLSQGADLLLLKPIKPAQLIGAISARIGHARTLRQRLQWLSLRDPLTGLLNRHALRVRLDRQLREWQEQSALPAVLFYIEPDRFRALRDRLGLASTDLLLADIAAWLQSRLPPAAELAHLGNGCFCVLSEQDVSEACDLAQKICGEVAERFFSIGRDSLSISLSIGLARPQITFRSGEDWLGAAALACDLAHDAGGGRVQLQRAVAVDIADREQYARYSQLLRNALEANGFYCVYQPIMALRGQPLERYDVLLRMRDESGRELNVERMFAVAKSEGLQRSVDRWVVEHVLSVLQRRANSGNVTTFFIKLSADTLADPGTGAWIEDRLTAASIDNGQVVFEFSEADISAAVLSADRLFAHLRGLGCGIALEHFGSVPGSARVLGRLPVDYVKVDAGSMRRPGERERLGDLIERSGAADAQVIAGFVEDASSLAVLWQLGVHYIQGNFLQEPADALEFDFRGELAV